MDDDPVRKGLVVRLDVKCPLLAVQCVLLDEVDVVHTCNLHTQYKTPVTQRTTITDTLELQSHVN